MYSYMDIIFKSEDDAPDFGSIKMYFVGGKELGYIEEGNKRFRKYVLLSTDLTKLNLITNALNGSSAFVIDTGETYKLSDNGWLKWSGNTSCYAQFVEQELAETISDSWSEIFANETNGTYSTKYSIGDTKLLDLGTEGQVLMQIVAFDTDQLETAAENDKAPITWISKQLLKTSHRMNPAYSAGTEGTGSLGGWEKTEMRSYLKETIKPLIPETVRNAIKSVKKYTRIYNVSGSAVNNVLTTEDVWIPSYQEVFGNYSYESSGVCYSTVFPDNASRVKNKAGSSATWWWLRSAINISGFGAVYTGGSSNCYNTDYTSGVALGFCT